MPVELVPPDSGRHHRVTDANGRPASSAPPHVIANGTGLRHAVAVTSDASTMVVEMAVQGNWSPELAGKVDAGLQLCLAGPSRSVIVDLHGMADPHGVSQPFWLSTERSAPARLALCLPPGRMLDFRVRNAGGDRPLTFAAMPEARAAAAGRIPRTHRMQARLDPKPASVRMARQLVAQACETWFLAGLRSNALLVVSELAANAVEHARTGFVVTVSHGGTAICLAVRDGTRSYPRINEPVSPTGDRGRGLLLVNTAASMWGVMPTRAGKVVWATVGQAS